MKAYSQSNSAQPNFHNLNTLNWQTPLPGTNSTWLTSNTASASCNQRAQHVSSKQSQLCFHLCSTSSGWRHSDLSLTNSLATSSLERWDRIRRTVQPVSSRCIHFASGSQQAQLPFSTMSRSCNTATPIRRSSRAKQ